MPMNGGDNLRDLEEGHRHCDRNLSSGADNSDTGLRSSFTEKTCLPLPGSSSSPHQAFVELDFWENGIDSRKVSCCVNETEKVCRICYLGLQNSSEGSEVGIELGCSCKDDLAAVHRQCAEMWFKIKGDKTCEVCGSTALNIAGTGDAEAVEQPVETVPTAATVATLPSEGRSFWMGHRFLNFLLACMIFSFIISWLFHFNVPAQKET